MARYDLIVRGGTIVTEAGSTIADVAVADGRFVAIEPDIEGSANETIAAARWDVLPGVIDAHVHFNEPGRTEWEGWASGSAALAAGGGTACCEMPLNAHPPTLDAASFAVKRAAAEQSSRVDFALWGGLTPTNVDRLPELAACGVVGFKAFMSDAGTDDFPHADDDTLFMGMCQAAALGVPVAVHAENDAITRGRTRRAQERERTGVRDYLASRPVIAELEAIARAIVLAEEAGCALHVVHVSTGRGVALVAEARDRGVDVTCETCPHYLVFTEDDVARIGALAKCAPPLRDEAEQEMLWTQLLAGDVDLVASDHSPAPSEMKEGTDFFAVWGGINGCQHGLPALVTAGQERGLALSDVARLTAGAVARRFRLPGKGAIAVGNDADFCLGERLPVEGDAADRPCFYRHPRHIWDGQCDGFRVVTTVRRGEVIVRDGKVAGTAGGRLLRPTRS